MTVEEYLDSVPEPARAKLTQLRALIRAAVPAEATEVISYGIPVFKYKGSLVAYAAFAKHCSLFPMNGTLVAEFADDLQGYKTSKGTIQFPLDRPLPKALVRRIVKARLTQNGG